MDQFELTSIFVERPQNFSWLLGAGTSRASGLPTAADLLWSMKRQYYCRQENQEIKRQDLQNDGVKERIQSFMESKGFPELWAEDEYSAYFKKIFSDDVDRQRTYIKKVLSEDNVSLSIGNRVLAALMTLGLCRVAFTTNFDSVVEKSLAEVGGQSLSAYHLEGAHSANSALNNEEFPLYCKLHGDFRYDSLKNLPDDLVFQNEELSKCFINAGSRFGLIVVGYSGRDESVMRLFHNVLETTNPFPHGLFWTGIKGSPKHPSVTKLLDEACAIGVKAHYVEIETFDVLLSRFWRNIENKSPQLDAKVRKSQLNFVDIPLPKNGGGKPIIRFNALPLLSLPRKCQEISFNTHMDWSDLSKARQNAETNLMFTKSNNVLC